MTDYLVTTPKNPQYTGKAYGVRFEHGRAFISQYTIDPSLGWSVDEVAQKLAADFGYEVQPVNSPVAAANNTSRKKRSKARAAVALEELDA